MHLLLELRYNCLFVFLFLFSLTTSAGKSTQINPEKVAKENNKTTVLSKAPLNAKELARKESLRNYIKDITAQEMDTSNVLYYSFTYFDNPLCLRVLAYLMDNANVIKVGASRDALAIVCTPAFNKIDFELNLKNLEFDVKPISKQDYQLSLSVIK
ncbi:MAG TPA: hypothetical protein PKZ66_08100 [Chitinophagaceae bacterium]|nr:hypothetical protein [Chitinophagaceae bacterium]